MALINKEKVLSGVGKAVDVTNSAAEKVTTYVKENELDKKAKETAKNVASTVGKGVKIAEEKVSNVVNNFMSK